MLSYNILRLLIFEIVSKRPVTPTIAIETNPSATSLFGSPLAAYPGLRMICT